MAIYCSGEVDKALAALQVVAKDRNSSVTTGQIYTRLHRAAKRAGYDGASELVRHLIEDPRPYTKRGATTNPAPTPSTPNADGDTIELNGVIYQRVS